MYSGNSTLMRSASIRLEKLVLTPVTAGLFELDVLGVTEQSDQKSDKMENPFNHTFHYIESKLK